MEAALGDVRDVDCARAVVGAVMSRYPHAERGIDVKSNAAHYVLAFRVRGGLAVDTDVFSDVAGACDRALRSAAIEWTDAGDVLVIEIVLWRAGVRHRDNAHIAPIALRAVPDTVRLPPALPPHYRDAMRAIVQHLLVAERDPPSRLTVTFDDNAVVRVHGLRRLDAAAVWGIAREARTRVARVIAEPRGVCAAYVARDGASAMSCAPHFY
jgi:hypothetical protein